MLVRKLNTHAWATYFTIQILEDVPEGVDSRPKIAQIVKDNRSLARAERSTTTTYSFISRSEAATMQPSLVVGLVDAVHQGLLYQFPLVIVL